MAKRKASSSPQPDYDSDEIQVTHGRGNNPQKAQKTSHDVANSPLLRRNRRLECVLIPTPTPEESEALLDAYKFTSADTVAGARDHAVTDHREAELSAYERPLVLNGKRSRKFTYNALARSEFFPKTQSQAAVRDYGPARKSTT